MRILQINGTYKHGGPGYTTEYVHKAVINNGSISKVFSTCENKEEFVYSFETKWLTFFRKVLTRLKINTPITAFFQTNKIIKLINSYSPDLVHIRIIHHGYLDYNRLFKYLIREKKPIVLTLHDMWFMTGGCYHYIKHNCSKYLHGCHNCPKTRKELDNYRFLTSYHLKRKDVLLSKTENLSIIAVSEWQKKQISNSILSRYSNQVISNAIDTNIFSYTESNYFNRFKKSDNTKIIIGVAANWSNKKGLDKFIEIAPQLGENYLVILIGNKPKMKIEYPTNLIITGRVSSKVELAKAYSAADVFVHLSEEETFGLVIAEAACCGLKVIGLNSTGISEVVRRSKGTLVEVGNTSKLLCEIKSVCDSGDRLSPDELNDVRNEFSLKRMQDEHLDLYHRILSKTNQ